MEVGGVSSQRPNATKNKKIECRQPLLILYDLVSSFATYSSKKEGSLFWLIWYLKFLGVAEQIHQSNKPDGVGAGTALLGIPGWRNGMCIRIFDNMFRSPSARKKETIDAIEIELLHFFPLNVRSQCIASIECLGFTKILVYTTISVRFLSLKNGGERPVSNIKTKAIWRKKKN